MVNKVTLIGHLGKDPEIRTLENGIKVATFTLATNENYKDKNDNWQTITEWHNIVVWRNLADRVERDLKKGHMAYIEGKITHRKYTDKEGVERSITEVVANNVNSLEKRESRGQALQSGFTGGEDDPFQRNSVASNTSQQPTSPQEDDLPF